MKDGILTTHVNVYEKITNGKYMLLNDLPETSITPIFNKNAKMYINRACQQHCHNAIFHWNFQK